MSKGTKFPERAKLNLKNEILEIIKKCDYLSYCI